MDLSVIIPCHNDGALLLSSVGSIVRQDWLPRHYELLLISDRVDAETGLALEEIKQIPNVKVIENNGDRGAANSRNIGIAAAQGEWIAFLDGDDCWVDGSVHRRWQAIKRHPEAKWIFGDFNRIDTFGSTVLDSWFLTRNIEKKPYQDAFDLGIPSVIDEPMLTMLYGGGMPWTGTVMVRRDVLQAIGGFDARLVLNEDNHLWLRLAQHAWPVFIPAILASYRYRPSSLTNSDKPPGEWRRAMLELLLDDPSFAAHREEFERRLNQCVMEDFWFYRQKGEMRQALRMNLVALKRSPASMSLWRHLVGTILHRR